MKSLNWLQVFISVFAIIVTIIISSFTAAWAINDKIQGKFKEQDKKINNHEIRIVKLEVASCSTQKILASLAEGQQKQGKTLGKVQTGVVLLLKKNGISTEILSKYDTRIREGPLLYPGFDDLMRTKLVFN